MAKRIATSKNYYRATYPTTVLHLNEIESIYNSLREFSVEAELKLITEDFEFDSVDEFEAEYSGMTISKLDIVSNKPYIKIELSHGWREFHGSCSDLKAKGLCHTIDTTLKTSQRKPKFLFKFINIVIFHALLLFSVFLGSNKVAIFALIPYPALLWAAYTRAYNATVIRVYNRAKHLTFLGRNKDKLILVIISAFLSALVTLTVSNFDFLKNRVSQHLQNQNANGEVQE